MSHFLLWKGNLFVWTCFVLLSVCSFSMQADTFRDDFNARNASAYNANNGTHDWTGSWNELNDDNNPLGGDIQVYITSNAGTRPGVRIQRNTGGGVAIWREVNLFGYTSAALSFTYQRVNLDNANDYAAIEISSNGGTSWTRLATFAGPTNDAGPQNFSQDISAYISTNTRIRFIGSPTLGGTDRVFFDSVEIIALPDKPVALSPFAYYDFDETQWTGAPGEVLNKGSGGGNATALGVAAGVNSIESGKICYAANIPRNTTAPLQYAIDTGIDLDTQIGSKGHINFWYRSNSNWRGGGTRVLLDASEDGPPNALRRIFYLNLLNDGSLRFALQDSNQRNLRIRTGANTFAANEWVHIAINWKLSAAPTARAEIWINGSKQTVSFEQNNLTSTTLGNLQSLYIGDNRSTAYAPGGNPSANGVIDELRIYPAVLPSTNINADKNATHPCGGLVADYRFDEFGWDGSAGEIIDSSGNGLNGASVNVTDANEGGTYTAFTSDVPNIIPDAAPLAGNPGSCRFGRMTGPAAGNRSHVLIADNSLLDLSDELTIMAWIYPLAYPGAGGLASIVSKDINSEFHLRTNGALNWWWGGGVRSLTTPANAIQLNQWQHVAIVYSRSGGFQQIYINGVQVAAGTNTNQALTLTNAPLLIGADIATGGVTINERIFNGFIDEVKIFNKALSSSQLSIEQNRRHDCVKVYYGISVGASASTCVSQPVTLGVYSDVALTNKITDFTGRAYLTTSTGHGIWSKDVGAAGVLSPSPTTDNGYARYKFSSADGGDVLLRLENQRAESLSISVNGAEVPFTSNAVEFRDNAFVITEDPLQVAGKPQSMQIALWRRDTTQTPANCSIATAYTGSKDLKSWIVRDAADPAGVAPSITSVSLPSGKPATNNLNLTFTAGVANFLLNTTDVGKYKLNLLDDSKTFASLTDLAAETAALIVRPFGFDVQATGNPAAADANGDSYIAAGVDFNLVTKAVLWESGDDADNNGVPDDYAELNNNSPAPAYGQEKPSGQKPALLYNLLAPASGSNGALSQNAISNFSSGIATNAINFSEVGIIKLEIDDSSYLGGGAVHGETGSVGRFIPHHFTLTSGAVTHRSDFGTACTNSAFTYMNENFQVAFDISANNAAGAITENYEGDFAKLVSAGIFDFQAVDGSTNLVSPVFRLSPQSVTLSWTKGFADDVLATLQLIRVTAPDGPFRTLKVGAAPRDTDGVTVRSIDLNLDTDLQVPAANDRVQINATDIDIRYGRLELLPAYGPETRALPMMIQTEFFNGTAWQVNNDDNCTDYGSDGSLTALAANLTNFTDNLAAGETGGQFPALATPVSAGRSSLTINPFQLSAPGANNTGTVQVTLSGLQPYLVFPWAHCGVAPACGPRATASFGLYRGNDRVIYWRELVRP